MRSRSGVPQNGRAGLAQREVSGPMRSPRPAANTIAREGAAGRAAPESGSGPNP